jgi:HTH-type transcriptional regulator, transcriptional repressor of NAD biosynthesis genes
MKTHGLTLGKFAPLHAGHQYLIDTALREVEDLSVIIYDCPEVTLVPLNIRAAWLRDLYPTVRVIEAWDGPSEVGNTPEIKQIHEDYVLKTLKITGITHFYSSEFYGEHMSAALGAINRVVDRDRQAVPVSGTMIRRDPYSWRAYMLPRVYRDLITNVVFLGAPSTGKTTIASHMARAENTVWMPEYGREYWEEHQIDRRLTLDQLVEIAEEHLAREEALLLEANRTLYTDTSAITTYMFSLYYHGAAHPRLEELAFRASSRYDVVFVCDTDIPYDDTWDRSGDVSRQVFQKQIVSDLVTRKIPFFLLRGDIDARMRTVQQVMRRYPKYTNIVDCLVAGE